jgi:hypothetical protein
VKCEMSDLKIAVLAILQQQAFAVREARVVDCCVVARLASRSWFRAGRPTVAPSALWWATSARDSGGGWLANRSSLDEQRRPTFAKATVGNLRLT